MSRTLLAIMSYAGAKDQVCWLWPHYRKSGCDILGTCPLDSDHEWPSDIEYNQAIGLEGYSTPDLIWRFVGVFELFLTDKRFSGYDSLMVIEYDSLFLKPAPPVPEGVFTHLAGGNLPGFKSKRFYHCPWAASRSGAEIVVEEGNKLIEAGEFERGSPDYFLGLIIDRRPDLALHETNTFSVNGGNLTERKSAALEAILKGAWFLHGLRTQEELKWILEAAG